MLVDSHIVPSPAPAVTESELASTIVRSSRATAIPLSRAHTRSQSTGLLTDWHLHNSLSNDRVAPAPASAAASPAPAITRKKTATDASSSHILRRISPAASDNQRDPVATQDTDSSSELDIPLASLQPSPKPKAARARGKATSHQPSGVTKLKPKPVVFAKPHKSPLLLQQEKEQEQREKEEKRAAKEFAQAQTRAANDVAKSKSAAEGQIKREKKKLEKLQELAELMDQDRIAPPLWALRLPSLPPRQNITGRALPMKVPSVDDTLPSTEAARTTFVAQLVDAMRDVRQAEDAVSPTVDFWYVWLKPSLEGKYSYNEHDMEWICRKLVSTAEGLHHHGLGATEIFCPRAIQKAQAAKEMTFKERIDKLADLMRKSKARCNNFMLNNTLEDTVALIDLKISDQVSNGNNNRTRSMKLVHSNNLLGIEKGMKWPKDKDGKLMVPGVTARTSADHAPEDVDVSVMKKDPADKFPAQMNEGLQPHVQRFAWPAEPTQHAPSRQQQEPQAYRDLLTYPRPTTYSSPATYLDPLQYPQYQFGGFTGPAERPVVRTVNDRSTAGLDAVAANRDFDAMYAAHHGGPIPAERNDDFMSQFVSFDDGEIEIEEELAEDARRKRPRHEQTRDFSINDLMRGKTAMPSSTGSKKTRR